MSFKREGDDVDLLRNLKMRRVGELLGDHIPEDEATLLSNGRLTCLICLHRPIFDTIPMLATHRRGKKHMYELTKFLSHKRELQLRQMKLDQQNFLRTGTVTQLKKKVERNACSIGSRRAVLNVPTLMTSEKEVSLNGCDVQTPSAQSQVRQYLKGLWKKKGLEKTIEKCRENYGNKDGIPLHQCYGDTSTPVKVKKPIKTSELPSDGGKNAALEHELKLRMSGWIKSDDGKWMKDPNAEFDSDEDEPSVSG